MGEKFYGLLFGIIFLMIGIAFTFFGNKLIQIQGESRDGDLTIEQRKGKLKIVGIGSLIVGLWFILRNL